MERGSILQSLKDLARRLEETSIPYAVVGAIALARHGLVRMTLDIDVLLSPEGLERFKARYLGRGYVPALPGAGKTFRAADSGVRIEVITAGEYPGDGKPEPMRFPHPVEFADGLDASVQPLYRELWQEAQAVDPLQEP